MVRLHWEFEWDEKKAASNFKKHGISFDVAAEVLQDPDGDRFHFDRDDPGHSELENRYITTGSHPDARSLVLVVSWTDRGTDVERVTRIISARKATKREIIDYGQAIGG